VEIPMEVLDGKWDEYDDEKPIHEVDIKRMKSDNSETIQGSNGK
jgi:hypothetical protein